MTEQEKQAIKSLALNYGDPIRGKILALIAEVESLENEVVGWKKHATDFEEMFKQEHREKNVLKREVDRLRSVNDCEGKFGIEMFEENQRLRKALKPLLAFILSYSKESEFAEVMPFVHEQLQIHASIVSKALAGEKGI